MTAKPRTAKYRPNDDGTGVLTIAMYQRNKLRVTDYHVSRIDSHPNVADPAFELVKEDGEVYHVAMDEFGYTCSCPHYVYRGHNSEIPCKHCMALVAVGLIPRPKVYPGRKQDEAPEA